MKMNKQSRSEKASKCNLKWKVRTKAKGQKQQDVPFTDGLICLRHLGSLHALANLICFIILTSRYYLLHLTEKKAEGQGG